MTAVAPPRRPSRSALRPGAVLLALVVLVSLVVVGGTAQAADAQGRAVVTRNLVRDGGFEGPNAWNRSAGTNFVEWRSGQVSPSSTARSGARYGATNTSVSRGSIWQDTSLSTAVGATVCASAWVRTQAGATGAAGTLAVRLMGGSSTDSGFVNFSDLGNGWGQVRTCVQATTSHSVLRVQLYPRTNGPTVDIDDVDVHGSLAWDSGFEGANRWKRTASTNFVEWRSGQVSSRSVARSGARYGATNTSARGGSIWQDLTVSTAAGDTICASAYVRTQAGATGAAGTLALWLLGGAPNENGSTAFAGLGNGWGLVRTCVQATGSHSVLRVQLYPKVNGPTVDIDDLDVHASRARDGGFEGPNAWSVMPGTNYVEYRTGRDTTERARSGSGFGATNTSAAGGGIHQDNAVSSVAGQTFCASAYVRTHAGQTGGAGTFAVWLLGGAYDENGSTSFSQVGTRWGIVQTCVQATTAHTGMRIQFYPRVNGPTLVIDDVDVH